MHNKHESYKVFLQVAPESPATPRLAAVSRTSDTSLLALFQQSADRGLESFAPRSSSMSWGARLSSHKCSGVRVLPAPPAWCKSPSISGIESKDHDSGTCGIYKSCQHEILGKNAGFPVDQNQLHF